MAGRPYPQRVSTQTSTPDYGLPPLHVVCFANVDVDLEDSELRDALNSCDLVVALGNVDLDEIAAVIGLRRPALCVRGGRDPQPPPPPFVELDGSGVMFNGWRIGGLSGELLDESAPRPIGVARSEEEAERLLTQLKPCDILISHAPAAGKQTPEGFRALTRRVQEQPPLYHLFATHDDHRALLYQDTLMVGVYGALAPDPLIFA